MNIIENKEGIYTHFCVPSSSNSKKKLLIELPHGATKTKDFLWYQQKLQSTYPKNLIDFFYVNTDVGSPEIAFHIAQKLLGTYETHILQSHIPRTFIDCNRVVGEGILYTEGGVTPATPSYVTDAQDVSFLYEQYHQYQKYVRSLYTKICEQDEGQALMLHTYAPRSVPITQVDFDIVEQLHAYYKTDKIQDCPLRPEIDIIYKTPDGENLIDATWIQNLKRIFGQNGFFVADGDSYPLHPVTTAYEHAHKNPSKTMCLEIRRDLVVQDWDPFVEMSISESKAVVIASCIADSLL